MTKPRSTITETRSAVNSGVTPRAEVDDVEFEYDDSTEALIIETAVASVHMTKFTPKTQQAYLTELRRNGGKYRAAAAVGISYECTRSYRANNPEFEAQVEIAMGLYRDDLLREAHRRAVEGWDERPIVNNDGDVVGYVHKHSDRLLELLLKQADPSFRDNSHTAVNINNLGGAVQQAAEFAELANLSGAARENLRAILEEMKASRDPIKEAIDVTSKSEDSADVDQ